MVYGPGSRPVSKVLDFIEKGCSPHTLELMLDPANWESGRQQGPTDVSLWPLPLFPSSDRPPHGIIVWRATLKQSGGQSVTRSVCLKQCQSVIPYLDTESFMGVAHTPFFPSCVPILWHSCVVQIPWKSRRCWTRLCACVWEFLLCWDNHGYYTLLLIDRSSQLRIRCHYWWWFQSCWWCWHGLGHTWGHHVATKFNGHEDNVWLQSRS